MNQLTNVLLWIKEPTSRVDLQESLSSLRGVNKIDVNQKRPYYLMVDYDYGQTNSMTILEAAREHNPETYIIGM